MWSPGELLESVGWVILGFGVAFVIDWGAKDRQQTYYAFGLEKSRSARALQLTARSRAVNFRFRHVVLLALVIAAIASFCPGVMPKSSFDGVDASPTCRSVVIRSLLWFCGPRAT